MNWHELFNYDPDTGKLFWKIQPSHAVKHGEEAGSLSSVGYIDVRFKGRLYKAHRIIWDMMNPDDKLTPSDEIDHINHIRTDNRINNLSKVRHRDNAKNQSMRLDNNSGVTGVHYDRQNRKWRARIKASGRTICLGRYDTLEEAALARRQAEVTYGFHKNHGAKKNDLKD
jgi:hypothetical protein